MTSSPEVIPVTIRPTVDGDVVDGLDFKLSLNKALITDTTTIAIQSEPSSDLSSKKSPDVKMVAESNPDKVKVERKVDEMGVLITLSVDPSDMGKIIGKEGRTAKAIRTLLRVVGAKRKARVNLKIYEPEGSHRGPRHEGGMGMGPGMGMGSAPRPQQEPADSIDEFKL